LQFDFRGFFPLTARSIGSGVSRLQWPMLSWFSILFRGLVSLCCALPILISIGVAPLLRRRLSRFTRSSPWLSPRFTFAGWFHGTPPRLASSFARLVPLASQPFSQFTYKFSSLTIYGARFALVSASCAASLRTYRLSLLFAQALISIELPQLRSLQNSFSRRLLLLCVLFDKELGDLSR
jgi:hypothetical protein